MVILNSELIGDVAYAYIRNEKELAEFANDVNPDDQKYTIVTEWLGEGLYIATPSVVYSERYNVNLLPDGHAMKVRRQLRQFIIQAEKLLNAF